MWRAVCDESRKHGSEGGKDHLASQGTPTLPYHIQMPAKGPYTIKGYKVVVVDSEGNEIEKKAQWLFIAVDSPTRSRFVTVPTATVRPSERNH